MAKNTNNRIPVKWVRDKAKAAYQKKTECHVCSTQEDLELHHYASITLLLNAWATRKGYNISTDEGILEVRDEFIAEHNKELYDDAVTLCNLHHVALHSIYGKAPALNSAEKQKFWIERQKAKYEGGEITTAPRPELSFFGAFTT